MRYKNIRTGAVIETSSQIRGGDWKEIAVKNTEEKAEEKAESGEKAAPAKTQKIAAAKTTSKTKKTAVKK